MGCRWLVPAQTGTSTIPAHRSIKSIIIIFTSSTYLCVTSGHPKEACASRYPGAMQATSVSSCARPCSEIRVPKHRVHVHLRRTATIAGALQHASGSMQTASSPAVQTTNVVPFEVDRSGVYTRQMSSLTAGVDDVVGPGLHQGSRRSPPRHRHTSSSVALSCAIANPQQTAASPQPQCLSTASLASAAT